MSAIYEAVSGAFAGIGTAVGSVLGVVKGAQTQSKAIGVQRDIANRQLALAETAQTLLVEQADKDRANETSKLNSLLKFYGEQAGANRELAAALGTSDSSASVGGSSPLLLLGAGVLLLFLLKGKKA